jgi:hypothetical protein
MNKIAIEQRLRKPCEYFMMTELYTMDKYNKNPLTNFKKLWADAHFNNVSNELYKEDKFIDKMKILNGYFLI